jgi:crotonobetainyl-CoA:carnitine CoA-transferase CaiB-like acyl-CoA transferase
MSEKKNFFEELIILELASVLAGPWAGRYLSALGAKVIKLENRLTGGDVTRTWKSPGDPQDASSGSYYLSVNEGKEVRMIRLTETNEQKQFFELLEKADVLITNFPEGAELKAGIHKSEILRNYPRLVWVNILGYASNKSRPAYDLIIQAESGFMYLNREPDALPQKMPVALMDILTGHQAVEAVLTALWHREKTGKGGFAEVYLMESALSALANIAADYTVNGYEPKPCGSLHPNIAPYGEIFTCSDQKHIVLAIGNDRQFRSLCKILNLEHLVENPLFHSNAQRVKNRKTLYTHLQEKIAAMASDVLTEQCRIHNIPAGLILDIPSALELGDASLLFRENQSTLSPPAFRFYPTA